MHGTPPGQAPTAPSVPCVGVPSVTFAHVSGGQPAEVVNGRQMGTVPPAHTVAVTFGVVISQTVTVTVVVAEQQSESVIRYVNESVPVKFGLGV